MTELFTRRAGFAALCLSLALSAAAAPAGRGAQLITDEQGYMVCHLCGPDNTDRYLTADYPKGAKEKAANYTRAGETSRYAILMSSDAPETAANQTPDFWYIDKQADSPSLTSIVFDDDNSNLSRADNITVDDEAGVTRLSVIWANGKHNEFALPD